MTNCNRNEGTEGGDCSKKVTEKKNDPSQTESNILFCFVLFCYLWLLNNKHSTFTLHNGA